MILVSILAPFYRFVLPVGTRLVALGFILGHRFFISMFVRTLIRKAPAEKTRTPPTKEIFLANPPFLGHVRNFAVGKLDLYI